MSETLAPAAFFTITYDERRRGLPLNLSVEESGAIEFLGQRIAQEGRFKALHPSCHGDTVNGHPMLVLEKPEGGLDLVRIVPLSRAFGEDDKKPKLVFLSACPTGEHGAASAFVQSLVRSGGASALRFAACPSG